MIFSAKENKKAPPGCNTAHPGGGKKHYSTLLNQNHRPLTNDNAVRVREEEGCYAIGLVTRRHRHPLFAEEEVRYSGTSSESRIRPMVGHLGLRYLMQVRPKRNVVGERHGNSFPLGQKGGRINAIRGELGTLHKHPARRRRAHEAGPTKAQGLVEALLPQPLADKLEAPIISKLRGHVEWNMTMRRGFLQIVPGASQPWDLDLFEAPCLLVEASNPLPDVQNVLRKQHQMELGRSLELQPHLAARDRHSLARPPKTKRDPRDSCAHF